MIPEHPPAGKLGEISTNSPRNRPYDRVLASASLDKCAVPATLADLEFPHGLVFDIRVFEPLEEFEPVRKSDSAAPDMRHLRMVRDFRIP